MLHEHNYPGETLEFDLDKQWKVYFIVLLLLCRFE